MIKGQKGFSLVMVAISAAIVLLITLAFLPVINIAIMGGDWTISSAIIKVNEAGYTATSPTGDVYVDDIDPKADSTYTIGDLANEYAEGHFDDLYLLGSYVGKTGISDIFLDCIAMTATHVRSDEDLSEAIPNTFTLTLQPDVPRTLSFHFDGHAQVTDYQIDLLGINSRGDSVSETFTQAADGWDWESEWAYAKVTSITMSARTGTGAGDTMDVGITDVLGLSNNINLAGDVYKIKKNNANATIVSGDVSATFDTYDMHTITLGAADDFTIWYDGNISYTD